MDNTCIYHSGIEGKIEALEKQLDDLKDVIQNYPTKDEVNIIISRIERDIDELKNQADLQHQNNINLHQAIIRLEEMNNYLKSMLDIYTEQTKSLNEKMDKINETLSDKIEKIYSLIVERIDANKIQKEGIFFTFFNTNKYIILIILFLVAIIIYLLTGKWIFEGNIKLDSLHFIEKMLLI